MAFRAQMRGDTAAVLAARNEVLLDREFCFETDTGLFKLGDGSTQYNSLGYWELAPFFSGPATMEVVANPSTPPASQMHMYAHSVAGRIFPKYMGPSGLDNTLQAGLQSNYTSWLMPGATTAMTLSGPTVTVVGTMSHPAIVSGFNLRQSMRRASILSAATANSVSHLRQAVHECYRGEVFGSVTAGGFFFSARFGTPTVVANQRVLVGLSNSTSAIPTTQDPAVGLVNFIGAGWSSADANLQIMHNDGAGNATKVNLGASFPTNNVAAVYELTLFCPPNGDAVGYRVLRLDTGDSTQGTLSTDLPAKSLLLCFHAYMNNGGTAAAVTLDIMRKYLESDY